MLQQFKDRGEKFFRCPADGCEDWLRHSGPGKVVRVEGFAIKRQRKLGEAPCGAIVCLACQQELPRHRPIRCRDVGMVASALGTLAGFTRASNCVVSFALDDSPHKVKHGNLRLKMSLEELADAHVCQADNLINERLDKKTQKLLKDTNVKPCPHCGFGTEKNDGCNFMTCTDCKEHWCWETGKPRHGPNSCGGGHNCH
jgi:hypothetical protein